MWRRVAIIFAILLLAAPIKRAQPSAIQFQITSPLPPASGRLIVVISKSNRPEPRTMLGDADADAPITIAKDVSGLGGGGGAVIDKTSDAFPISSLDMLAAGDYFVQAVLHTNIDLNSPNAPGDRFSSVRSVHLDARKGALVALDLTGTVQTEQMPSDDQYVKYVKIQSAVLTRFHGRPIFLRAGIILPKDDGHQTAFPLRIHIGGYGTRYTAVQRLMAPNSQFRRMWLADDTPRFIFLQLDGDGPYGDPYQVNS
ncbi:MAG TPA: hypothetical protein VGK48_07225, partial [Terriglobia bacterium]